MLAGRDSSIFARFLLDVCSMSARCLFDVCLVTASCRLCFMHASYLLDVWSMFARSCKRGIAVMQLSRVVNWLLDCTSHVLKQS